MTQRVSKPTLNPDDSLWRDIVFFDRFSVKLRKKFERGDVVALKCVGRLTLKHDGTLTAKHHQVTSRLQASGQTYHRPRG